MSPNLFVQSDLNKVPINKWIFNMYTGLKDYGYNIIFVTNPDQFKMERSDILLSGWEWMHPKLKESGINYELLDYPEPLRRFLVSSPRKMVIGDLVRVSEEEEFTRYFLKPVVTKEFSARVVHKNFIYKNSPGIHDIPETSEIWVLENLEDIVSEFRIFVHNNQEVHIDLYCDLLNTGLEHHREQLISEFLPGIFERYKKESPRAYCLDILCTHQPTGDLKYTLGEVTDILCAGHHSISPDTLARLLMDRWDELWERG
jgi:hypothetical protein